MHDWINKLQLEKHIEGGYFAEFYKSTDKVAVTDERYKVNSSDKNVITRNAGSSIYFLLEKTAFSAWHQLSSDEIWHYYDGDSAILIHFLDANGNYLSKLLGHPLKNSDASFQVVVPAGAWFAAELSNKDGYALVGCTVSPGFEYQDFILADRHNLIEKFSQHANIIKRLTYEKIAAELGN
jgi:predicted cupin superfamily sugar epimerase